MAERHPPQRAQKSLPGQRRRIDRWNLDTSVAASTSLSDGRRVRGKAAAVEAQAAIPVGLVGRVEVLVVELRAKGALRGAGEALAELAVELAGRLTEGANAAMAHELREVLDDLEARGHAAELNPEDVTDDDGDDGGDEFDGIVVKLSSALGNAPGS